MSAKTCFFFTSNTNALDEKGFYLSNIFMRFQSREGVGGKPLQPSDIQCGAIDSGWHQIQFHVCHMPVLCLLSGVFHFGHTYSTYSKRLANIEKMLIEVNDKKFLYIFLRIFLSLKCNKKKFMTICMAREKRRDRQRRDREEREKEIKFADILIYKR